MNCKQGDLAIVVTYDAVIAPHVGKIVRCVAPIKQPLTRLPGWEIEPALPSGDCILDAALRPIRPGDVTDSEVRELYAPSLPEVA